MDIAVLGLISQIHDTTTGHHPASLPVAVNRSNIESLGDDFVVSVKADGTRQFVVIQDGLLLLVDRLNLVRRVYTEKLDIKPLCVADAELIEITPSKFIIVLFDLLVFNGHRIIKYTYVQRHKWLSNMLAVFPVNNADIDTVLPAPINGRILPTVRLNKDVTLTIKPIFHVHDLAPLMTHIDKFGYGYDGLVFTRNSSPIKPFRDTNILKWKSIRNITIDLLLFLDSELNRPYVARWPILGINRRFLSSQGTMDACTMGTGPNPSLLFFTRLTSDVPILHGKVYECAWYDDHWHVMHLRDDKDRPNNIVTIVSTIGSIQDEVTLDILLDVFGKIPM
jgi:hypothetical protein